MAEAAATPDGEVGTTIMLAMRPEEAWITLCALRWMVAQEGPDAPLAFTRAAAMQMVGVLLPVVAPPGSDMAGLFDYMWPARDGSDREGDTPPP